MKSGHRTCVNLPALPLIWGEHALSSPPHPSPAFSHPSARTCPPRLQCLEVSPPHFNPAHPHLIVLLPCSCRTPAWPNARVPMQVLKVSSKEAVEMARRLATEEGLLCGISSGEVAGGGSGEQGRRGRHAAKGLRPRTLH